MEESYSLDGFPIWLVGTPEDPQKGKNRWVWRVRNLFTGNFYGTQKDEKNFDESGWWYEDEREVITTKLHDSGWI